MSFLTRRKSIESITTVNESQRLHRTLSWWHLIALGVGAIVGTGIYTLIGVGAERAGPAVLIAFIIAGLVCVCAALAYAELATLMPVSGSAYTYSYAVIGEGVAWVIGWSLVLEYSVVCAAVAVGWSGYAVGFLQSAGFDIPHAFVAGPHAGGIINLPAIFIVAGVAGMLLVGTRESATFNIILVILKLAALAAFIALALPAFDAGNFKPFMPYGFASHEVDGQVRGVMVAAAIIFFAFYGFDAVSTAAEETKNPGRDLTIGIIGSMVVCTIVYMAVAAAAIGAMPFLEFSASGEPLAHVLRTLEHPGVATFIGAVAVVALPTVILAFMFGQSRIFFVMSRDGMLPERLGKLNKRGTPVAVTVGTALVVSAIAGFFPLSEIAELANAGTLLAFIAVGACLMVLRRRAPDAKRLFRCPAPYLVGTLAILGCLYLMFSLPSSTLARFVIWNAIGLAIYLAYGRRHSLAGKEDAVAA